MLRTTIDGLPGKYFSKKGAVSRAAASVPPPGSEPTIIETLLPLKSAPAAGSAAASAKARRGAANLTLLMAPSPCSSSPFRGGAAASARERNAGELAHHAPALGLAVPAGDDGIFLGQAALRRAREIIKAIDAGIAREMREMRMQRGGVGIGPESLQRVDDRHHRVP